MLSRPSDGAPPPPQARRRRWWPAAAVALWVSFAVGLQLVRQPGVPATDALWAEDGGIFLNAALRGPTVAAVFEPYASYLHVAPRMLSAVVAVAPLEQAALLTAVLASLGVAVLSVFVYVASGRSGVLRSRPARAALAAAMVALPAAGYEVNATLANLHWYLMFAAFWALLAVPGSRAGQVVHVLVVALAVLSDPLTVLLAPVLAWRMRVRRTRYGWTLAAVLLLGALVQGLVSLASDGGLSKSPTRLADLPSIYVLRVPASLLVGDRHLPDAYLLWGLPFAYACLLAVLGLLAYGVLRRGASPGVLAVLLTASAVFFGLPVALRGTAGYLSTESFTLNGSRYVIVPTLFLVTAVLHVLDRPAPAPGHGWLATRALVAAVAAVVAVGDLGTFNVSSLGPSWSAELRETERHCRAGTSPELAVGVEQFPEDVRPGEVLAKVPPDVGEFRFYVAVPCRRLTGD
jgi:hypothetical protein